MTTPEPGAAKGIEPGAVLSDGLLAGVIGAVTVIVVFLIYDAISGEVLRTPSTLAAVLFQGAEAAEQVDPDIGSALAYNGIHVLLWVAGGLLASLAFALVDRHPATWYLLFVAAAFVAFAFLYLDGALGVPGLGRLHLWAGGLLGAAAMAAFLWRCHPGIGRKVQHAFDER